MVGVVGRYLRGKGGGKQAEKPVSSDDGHLTLLCLQMLVQLGKLLVGQFLQDNNGTIAKASLQGLHCS